MADERDRWLDKAAADRLLRGEPVTSGADPHARVRSERLRAALETLADLPAAGPGELPGEAAAVAAFRAARGGAPLGAAAYAEPFGGAETVVDLSPPCGRAGPGTDRARGSGRGRPVRFALAAALASVAVGGVAAAVGAGLLDRDTDDTAGHTPAVSVSVGSSSTPFGGAGDATLVPQPRPVPSRGGQSPSATQDPGNRPLTDGRTPGGPGGGGTGTSGGSGTGPSAGGSTAGKDGKDRSGEGLTDGSIERDRTRAVEMCRDYRAGKLDADRREKLVRLAQGILRIPRYCQTVLDGAGGPGSGDALGAGTPAPTQPGGAGQGADGSLGLRTRR